MKKLLVLLAIIFATSSLALAHGNNDHVRGTITQIGADSITVQVSAKDVRTLTLTDKTTVERTGTEKAAKRSDLKIGDRVVIDVPKGSHEAAEIKFSPAAGRTK